MVQKHLDFHMQKTKTKQNFDLILLFYKKINSKWITNLNVESKTTRILER